MLDLRDAVLRVNINILPEPAHGVEVTLDIFILHNDLE